MSFNRQYNQHDDRSTSFNRGGKGGRGRGNYRSGPKNLRGGGSRKYRWTQGDARSRLGNDRDGDIQMRINSSGNDREVSIDRPPTRRGFRGNNRGVFNSALRGIGSQNRGGRGGYKNTWYKGRDNRESWYKIQIPRGHTYGKEFIMKAIRNICDLEFVPQQYRVESGMSVFFVQEKSTADAIRSISKRVTLPDGSKMIILVRACPPPKLDMTEEILELLKVSMSDRYDVPTKCLNMSDMYNDKGLNEKGVKLSLGRYAVMSKVIEIISENIPEIEGLILKNNRLMSLDQFAAIVPKAPNLKKLDLARNQLKSTYDLDKICKLKLEELNLEDNPLTGHFKENAAYVSAVRKIFPKVLKLDGVTLPPPISFDIDSITDLPAIKGNVFINDEIKSLLVKFIKEYFTIYDTNDRQPLLDAYHEHAVFSMSIFTNRSVQTKSPSPSGYISESRNLKRVTESGKKLRLLKYGKLPVVSALTELPPTVHDLNSFNVYVNIAENTILSFTLTGVFKDGDTKGDHVPVRSFSRVLVCIPQGEGIVIVNEQLTISHVSAECYKKYFKSNAPTPSSSPVQGAPPQLLSSPGTSTPITPAQQQTMVLQFAAESGMNTSFSERCLSEHSWDYQKAAGVFTKFNAEGKIPKEAFVK